MDVAIFIALYWLFSLAFFAGTLSYMRRRYTGGELQELEVPLKECNTAALLLIIVPIWPMILTGHQIRKMLGA